MSKHPFTLAETNWKTVKQTKYEVAVLPWGATEAHNYHLPYGTDNYEAEYVSKAAAASAWEAGAKVIVLPTVPFGVNTGQLDISLCLNMNPSTQYLVLKDIVDVLSRQGLQKLVIMNSHGGNNFKQMIRELSTVYPSVFICEVFWVKVLDHKQYFEEPEDHAGELETSVMMHIAPHLVSPLSEAGSGYGKKHKIKGLKNGWASTQRAWTKVTSDTGVGNPAKSSAAKGKVFLEDTVKEISEFFVELAAADINDLYE